MKLVLPTDVKTAGSWIQNQYLTDETLHESATNQKLKLTLPKFNGQCSATDDALPVNAQLPHSFTELDITRFLGDSTAINPVDLLDSIRRVSLPLAD